MKERILLSWSGGKDSCMTLYELQKSHEYEIDSLLTTITEDYDRISIHGVRTTLPKRQARSLGIPLQRVLISKDSANEVYESRMNAILLRTKQREFAAWLLATFFLRM